MSLAASACRCAIVVAFLAGGCGRQTGGHADGGAGVGGAAAGTGGGAGAAGAAAPTGAAGSAGHAGAGGTPDGGAGAGGAPSSLDDLLMHDGGAGPSFGGTPTCGAALCGNGTRDSCLVTADDGTVSSQSEACDLADLGGASCTGEGWGSGAMKCSSNCTLDRSGCSACMPAGGALQACGRLALPTRDVRALGLAANGDDLAVAWASSQSATTPVLELARLAPGLGSFTITELESTAHPETDSVSFTNVALAPLSAGWVVAAADSDRKLFVHALDASGADLGRVDVGTVPGDVSAEAFLSLAPRAGGGPCLFWGGPADLRAAVVAPDGRSVGKASDVALGSLVNVGVSNVVSLAGACFAVVAGQDAATMAPVTELVRFDAAAGGAPTVVSVLKGELVNEPRLVAGANELLLAHSGVSGMPHTLRRLLANGVESAAALPLGFATTLLAAAGDDAMLAVQDGSSSVTLERLSRAGTVVMPPIVVAKAPSASFSTAGAVHRTADTAIGWTDQRPGAPAFGVALLSP
jgi:hypothetical protein